jgi:hypothetical protein
MTTAEEWKGLPTDPDPEADLGYRGEPLTVVESSTESKLVFMPEREPQVGEEEFIVVSEESLHAVER